MPALYQKIADDVRDAILRGELVHGAKLPTEQELTVRYGVSRNTVRMAVASLVNQGLVATQPGRGGGAFVRDPILLTYYASAENKRGSEHSIEFDRVIRAQGAEPRENLTLSVIEAGTDIAERLHIPEGSDVALRRLLRLADNEPVSLQDSYYPMEIVEGSDIMAPRPLERGTIKELDKLGYVQVGTYDELVASMPTPSEARSLELRPGVPVLRHWRTAYSRERPIRVTLTVFAADRNRLVYEAGCTDAKNSSLRAV